MINLLRRLAASREITEVRDQASLQVNIMSIGQDLTQHLTCEDEILTHINQALALSEKFKRLPKGSTDITINPRFVLNDIVYNNETNRIHNKPIY